MKRSDRRCRNPLCGERLVRRHVLCPSCRLAAALGAPCGAVLAFLATLLWRLVHGG